MTLCVWRQREGGQRAGLGEGAWCCCCVPLVCVVCVCTCDVTISGAKYCSAAKGKRLLASFSILAKPKSMTTTYPSLPITRFSGLRSR